MLESIDAHLIEVVSALVPVPARDPRLPVREGSSLTGERCLGLFDAQVASRHLDLAARWLRGQGKGCYTIASAGHEGNAAVAAAVRPTDPALLHYRSGAFYVARGRQVSGQQPCATCSLAWSPRPRSRSRAAATRSSAIPPLP
jgi:2-oxoisovalerate dehydrogenase E1 component